MGGRATNDNYRGYNDNYSASEDAGLGPEEAEMILPSLAEDIASSAGDPEEALEMCRDAVLSEDLDDDQFRALVQMVEDLNDWELPGSPEDY